MAFFWFLIVVILLITLWHRPKASPDDGGYQQGYWDGYRALGERVQRQLDDPSSEIDRHALQAAIATGVTGVEPVEHVRMVDDAADMAWPAEAQPQPALVIADPQARSLRNLNVILYMASFLLIAAGVLFIGGTMSEPVKLIGVWGVIAAFYIGGYVLHQRSVRLRPASMAFLGTGLALIPFAGFALHAYTAMDADVAWLVTSIVGVVTYLFTAVRLQNQLVSYLSMAFILSLAMAAPSSVSLGLVWQFVLLIVVALAASTLALIRPRWVPAVFARPIGDTGQLVTPLVLVASLFVGEHLQLRGYEIIFAVATAYYLVAWLQARTLLHETALRIVAAMTVLLFAYDLAQDNLAAVGVTLLCVATIQAAYSLWRSGATGHRSIEQGWIIAMFIVQVVSFSWWQQSAYVDAFNVAGLLVIGGTSLAAMLRLRQVWFGAVGVVVSYVLPFVVARDLVDPVWPLTVLAIWFVSVAILVFAGLYRWRRRSVGVRMLLTIAYVGYVVLGIVAAFGYGSLGFTTAILAIFTVLLTLIAYVVRQTRALVFAGLLLFAALGCGWSYFAFSDSWSLFGVAWIGAAILYGGSWLSDVLRRQLTLYRQVMVILAAGALAVAGVVQLGSVDKGMAAFAALSLLAMAILMAIEGYRSRYRTLVEVSVYVATFALQRYVGLLFPDLNIVFYGHWWALTIAAATWLYPQPTMTRRVVGLAVMSATSAAFALGEGGWYQLLFLVEHIALLVFGALRSKSWALWWGLAGSALAVVYFLGGFNFLSLGFLGLLMIGIVVWRLLRGAKP